MSALSEEMAAPTQALAAIVPAFSVICFLTLVFFMVCQYKLFEKMGYAGWKALIPFYSAYIYAEATIQKGWMFVLSFLPIGNLVIPIWESLKLAERFGKSKGFAVGMILLPIVFVPMLAFGSAQDTWVTYSYDE